MSDAEGPPLKKPKLEHDNGGLFVTDDYLGGGTIELDDDDDYPTIEHVDGDSELEEEDEDDEDDEDVSGHEQFEPDWDTATNRYDSRDMTLEPLPALPAFSEAFEKVNGMLGEILSQFPDLTAAAGYDSRLEHLLGFVKKAQKLKEPRLPIIAFLGAAGKGKTSTQNNLLDMNIAETGSTGRSCTNVVTEFRQPLPGQARPFAAEVLWHDDKAIGKFLKEQLKNFRRMCEPDAAWSSEERREFEKDRNTAEELLHVLFSDRDEFASKRACRKYLTENQLLPLPDAIQQLTSWITDTISKQGREGGITKVEASTSLEIRQMLSPYMRHQEGRSSAKRPASFWPLVRCVRMGLQDPRIVDHVILADLPGNSVRNRFHENMSQAHLQESNGAWVFGDIARILDDNHLGVMLDRIFENYSSQEARNCAVVCTHADANMSDSIMTQLQNKPSVTVRAKVRECRKICKELAQVNEAWVRARRGADGTQQQALELECQVKELQERKFNALVDARNTNVVYELQKQYSSLVPDNGTIKVFCVSNAQYLSMKTLGQPLEPELEPAMTGIPQLRQFAMQLSAPRIEATRLQNVNACRMLLNTVGMWLKRQTVENPDEVLNKASEPQTRLAPAIQHFFDSRRELLSNKVLGTLDEGIDKFNASALAKNNRWDPKGTGRAKHWHHATWMSWCKRRGNHETKLQARLSWNEEFLEVFREVLKRSFDKFESALRAKYKRLHDTISELLDLVEDSVAGSSLPGIGEFQKLVQSQYFELERVIATEWERQIKLIAQVTLLATRDRSDGFFMKAMKSTYERMEETRGTGSMQVMRELLIGRLKMEGSANLFTIVTKCIERAFIKDDELVKDAFQGQILGIFQNIQDRLRVMLDIKDASAAMTSEIEEVDCQLLLWVKMASPKVNELWKEMHAEKRKFKEEQAAKIAAAKEKGKQRAT